MITNNLISSIFFFLPLVLVMILLLCMETFWGYYCNRKITFLISTLCIVVLIASKAEKKVALISFCLSCAFITGWLLVLNDLHRCFGYYIMVLSFFHWSEYVSVAFANPKSLSLDSFLLNHSKQYWIAGMSSWIEYFCEYYWFSSWTTYSSVMYFGLIVCIVGELFRKAAILTAKTNFTHLISYNKATNHKLVVHGIYRIVRHPAYVGWFWWSIGTQLVLVNPVCMILYALVSWLFFASRIIDEEMALLQFFGYEYRNYQNRVPSGIPFVKGYCV